MAQSSGIRVMGKVLGYPDCCITSHEKRLARGQAAPSELACRAMKTIPKGCKYHWIPCQKCASQILLGTATFASLLVYKRPLIDLTGKLTLPVVQQHAKDMLTQEEYKLYEAVATEGIGKHFKFSAPSLAQPRNGQQSLKRPARKQSTEPPSAKRKASSGAR